MIQQLHFGVFTQENGNTNLKTYMHLIVYCSIIYNSQHVEATLGPLIDERINKMWYICTKIFSHYVVHLKLI